MQEEKRLKKTLHNIWYRCNYPGTNKFSYYGGRNIKCLISLKDLEEIWERDNASNLKQPSINRKNPADHYTKENCQFIEFSENRRQRRFKKCKVCDRRLNFFSEFEVCYLCRTRPCHRCNKPFVRTYPLQQRCDKCNFVTRPCLSCGKPITRPNKVCFTRIERWACCMQHRKI
jgi:hypothetical protein